MLKLKKILFLCGITLICFACSKGERKVVAKYDDGKPFIVEYVKNKDGKETRTYEEHYYQNGKKRLEGKIENNLRSGIWKFYYEDGNLFAKADFSNSKEGKQWEIYAEKDSLLVKKTDKLLSIALSNEGTPVSIRLKRDKIEIFYRFFNSFKPMERVFLKGNIPQGEAMSWYENGSINSIHYYVDGMQDSIYTVYAENGQKIINGQFKKGTKVGKWEYFSSEGRPLGYDIYDMDGTKLSKVDNQGLKYSTKPKTEKDEKNNK